MILNNNLSKAVQVYKAMPEKGKIKLDEGSNPKFFRLAAADLEKMVQLISDQRSELQHESEIALLKITELQQKINSQNTLIDELQARLDNRFVDSKNNQFFGYEVISSSGISEYEANRDVKTAYLTILSSPYSCNEGMDLVTGWVKRDLEEKVLKKLHPKLHLNPQQVNFAQISKTDRKSNVVYNINLKANFKKGFYEVNLKHTLPLKLNN